MEIKKNSIYENRTYKYLYLSLRKYGKELTEQLKQYFKLAVGIGDNNLVEDIPGHIFILLDTEPPIGSGINLKVYQENFNNFLKWVRYQEYYNRDYIYKDNNLGDKHMLVLKLPLTELQFSNFMYGHYSSIYSFEEIEEFFKPICISNKRIEQVVNSRLKNSVDILTKSSEYIQTFVDIVNRDFKTNLVREDYIGKELDYPINLEEEIFNYK